MAKNLEEVSSLRLKTLQCRRDLLSTTLAAQALVSIEWKKNTQILDPDQISTAVHRRHVRSDLSRSKYTRSSLHEIGNGDISSFSNIISKAAR